MVDGMNQKARSSVPRDDGRARTPATQHARQRVKAQPGLALTGLRSMAGIAVVR